MDNLLGNHEVMRVALVLLGLVGMAMCTVGIGRVAAAGRWLDPLSLVNYVLGGAAVGIIGAALAGWPLPGIATEWQALLAVLLIIALKVVLTAWHRLPAA